MKLFLRKISALTILVVASVAILGIVCPMKEVANMSSDHSGCVHSSTILSSTNNQAMSDCMNGKLSFLSSFLVSLPENAMFLFTVLLVSIFSVGISQILIIQSDSCTLVSRWKMLYLSYFAYTIVLIRRSIFSWLIRTEHPVSIA